MRRNGTDGSVNAGRGIDFLGYVFSKEDVRLRKGIKKRFAAGMGRVKSRKRKRQILDSYKGWCEHGDCKNLWRKITGKKMGFADKGITMISQRDRDGKRIFDVKQVPLTDIINMPLTVLDFESNIRTRDIHDRSKQNMDKYVVMVQIKDGDRVKFITGSQSLKDVLDQCKAMESAGTKIFPVENVMIRKQDLGGGKSTYKFQDL